MKNRAKKILIAVGDSADSKNAVTYVAKNILLPVDSSDGALKTVKYVLDMIGGNPDVGE